MAFITEEQPQPIIAHWVSWRHLLTTEEVVIKGGAIRVYGKGRASTLYRPKRGANAVESIYLR